MVAHQQDAITLLAVIEHLLLHLCEPEIVGVEVIAQRHEAHPLALLCREHGVDHRLALLAAPGVADVRRAAVAAKKNQEPLGPAQRLLHQMEMAQMERLEPSDQDGDVVGHGEPQNP